eukprot:scaffold11926_cov126-Cylindrotheca_fusiformis.AAC.6
MKFLQHFICSQLCLLFAPARALHLSRRDLIKSGVVGGYFVLLSPRAGLCSDNLGRPFSSAAFSKRELSNSIVASRDTNISPMEVYEVLRSKLRSNNIGNDARALDVGAGAGVSTQVFYDQLGYRNIDAVDWSGDAWRENVVERGFCPPSVTFYEQDDERFVKLWKEKELPKYDIIAFNFGINRAKAIFFCRNLLKPDGLLLAPINTSTDYWLKQTYQLLDASGNVTWSASDVGAWAVQFQPDVTADTCQGVWCAPFNGFVKLKTY